ncbi:beta-defensin 110-like [Rhinopithecus roxellana]|uniref:beta-defensin 110-like n=1 Tax=Rhinopithecus bieti TaxID=61621 RepID=UPI00083C40A0|nr:PREDICTED: beta-defensin 110-like [Rhinopithecus bieti]XP_030785448.1 beta-defensin 110-like [Rhinopithecus roxellana]
MDVSCKIRTETFCASIFFLLAARSYFEPKYRFERCEKVRGICKTFCDDVEYDYGYCIKWRSQCCV